MVVWLCSCGFCSWASIFELEFRCCIEHSDAGSLCKISRQFVITLWGFFLYGIDHSIVYYVKLQYAKSWHISEDFWKEGLCQMCRVYIINIYFLWLFFCYQHSALSFLKIYSCTSSFFSHSNSHTTSNFSDVLIFAAYV